MNKTMHPCVGFKLRKPMHMTLLCLRSCCWGYHHPTKAYFWGNHHVYREFETYAFHVFWPDSADPDMGSKIQMVLNDLRPENIILTTASINNGLQALAGAGGGLRSWLCLAMPLYSSPRGLENRHSDAICHGISMVRSVRSIEMLGFASLKRPILSHHVGSTRQDGPGEKTNRRKRWRQDKGRSS